MKKKWHPVNLPDDLVKKVKDLLGEHSYLATSPAVYVREAVVDRLRKDLPNVKVEVGDVTNVLDVDNDTQIPEPDIPPVDPDLIEQVKADIKKWFERSGKSISVFKMNERTLSAIKESTGSVGEVNYKGIPMVVDNNMGDGQVQYDQHDRCNDCALKSEENCKECKEPDGW